MAEKRVKKKESKSFGERIKNAIAGVVIGLVLFLAAFPLLWWNEGRAVRDWQTLAEAEEAVISTSADEVAEGEEGKLVHLTGEATTDEVLEDDSFNVAQQGIILKRVAEMYQWQEEEEERNDTIEYTYSRTWASQVIDHSEFEYPEDYQNPASMKYEPREFRADEVVLGAYDLPDFLIDQMDNYEDLSPGQAVEDSEALEYEISGDYIYVGEDPAEPQVGDIRVSYQIIRPATVSVLARQTGSTFEDFQAEAGGTVGRLSVGEVTAEGMIEEARTEAVILTWILRGVGFLMMVIGVGLLFKPLLMVTSFIPVLGSLLSAGVFVIALAAGLVFTSLTIGLAWLFYRPILGLVVLIVGAAVGAVLVKVSAGGAAEIPETTAEA